MKFEILPAIKQVDTFLQMNKLLQDTLKQFEMDQMMMRNPPRHATAYEVEYILNAVREIDLAFLVSIADVAESIGKELGQYKPSK